MIKKIKLNGMDMYNYNTYGSDGLYAADDGVVLTLVLAENNDVSYLYGGISERYIDCSIKDEKNKESSIDINILLKAIAIAQNPELAKDLT